MTIHGLLPPFLAPPNYTLYQIFYIQTYVGQLAAMNDLLHKFLQHQDDSMKDYSKFALCTFSFNFFSVSKFAMFEPYTMLQWMNLPTTILFVVGIENYGKNSEVLSIAASQCLF